MKTYPLKCLSLEEATALQFRVVDCICKEFSGHEILSRGDLGLVSGHGQPITAMKAEKAISRIFNSQSALLVRGAGTGAIRYALFSVIKAGGTLLLNTAPVYPTTQSTIEMMGLHTVRADFNNPEDVRRVMAAHPEIDAALVQHTRQSMTDTYDLKDIISVIQETGNIPIITDDNYAVMKVAKIGSQCGADLSCFSTFKLMGPEGIGCVVGKKTYINRLKRHLYSGGSQTQGHEALDVLRGLVYAPVSFAIQAQVIDHLVKRLQDGELPGIRDAFVANAQSRVLLVEFEKPIAEAVLKEAEVLGAAPRPVGAESKYELVPMFYRVSGTFRETDPEITKRMIRINPMRGGEETVLRILKEAMKRVSACS